MGIFDRLTKASKAEDYEVLINDVTQEVAVAEARIADLTRGREDELFSRGADGLAKLDAEIEDVKKELETKRLTLAGLTRRRDESLAAAEKQAIDARALAITERGNKAMMKCLAEFDDAAKLLVSLVDGIRAEERRITEDNEWLKSVGRSDLAIAWPYSSILEEWREEARSSGVAFLEPPPNGAQEAPVWRNLPDYVAPPYEGLNIKHYYEGHGSWRSSSPLRFAKQARTSKR